MCGKCSVCIGPSDTESIRWGLCGFCQEMLRPDLIIHWVNKISSEHGVCYK